MVRARLPLLVILLASAPLAAPPWWITPTRWPVERLIENVTRHLEENPDSPQTEYCLGRIHGLAFQFQEGGVMTFDAPWSARAEVEPTLPTLCSQALEERFLGEVDGPPVASKETLGHLEEAVRHLSRAATLAPERADVRLSLAYVLQRGASLAGRVEALDVHDGAPATEQESALIERRMVALGDEGGPGDDAERETLDPRWFERSIPFLVRRCAGPKSSRATRLLERWWLDRAIEAYWQALSLARDADMALEEQPMVQFGTGLRELVSYEAGVALRSLLATRADEEERRSVVEATLRQLEDLPVSKWITPILLTLDGCPTVGDLDDQIDADAHVLFDLDGDGFEEAWPWPRPGTGWLVWDPDHTGRITSGQELFGSASGWFFFPDGYRVLDALDDDRDGRLRGAELEGIAVWFDRDSDGVSDPGEVTPVHELGIVALATHATEAVDASPASPCGAELADGRVLPTWDWVLRASGSANTRADVAVVAAVPRVAALPQPLVQTFP